MARTRCVLRGLAALSLSSASALQLEAAVAAIPHPAKAQSGGEDAHFMLHAPAGGAVLGAYGVFDGVGGWADEGVDAGRFSRRLAERTGAALMAQSWAHGLDLKAALGAGLREALEKEVGTTTACLLYVTPSGTLHALNLGDSGYRVVSAAHELKACSVEQLHGFNCPFQLGTGSADAPEDGEQTECIVSAGDVVLLASDGLLDNVHDAQLCELVGAQGAGATAHAVATAVATAARAASVRLDSPTPFALAARQAGFRHTGGKLDDVTVLCVRVLDVEEGDNGDGDG